MGKPRRCSPPSWRFGLGSGHCAAIDQPMRHVTPAGLALIKQFEGFSATVYICPAGYPTIGYGHVVKLQERGKFSNGITPEQAEALIRQDVQAAEHAVLRLIAVPLKDGQFDALVSFTFN
ncbi:MAG: lysozyme, partial [Holosporales bacterium]